MLYVLIFLLFLQFIILSKTLKYFFLSPVYIYILFSSLSIVISIIYFYFFDFKYNMYRLDEVTSGAFLNTIEWYLIALNSFIFGFLLFHNFSLRRSRKLLKASFNDALFLSFKLPKNIITIVSVLFFIIVVLYFAAYGFSLYSREEYLPKDNIKGLVVIIKLLSLIQVILLGIVYKGSRFLSVTYFIILFILSIGTGSRTVILFLILYFILIFISKGNNLRNKISFVVNMVLTFIFLGYLMEFRSQDSHGVFPYIESIFSNGRNRDSFFNVYYSLIFGVFVTIQTLKEAIPDWNVICISLNPMPGSMVGWYDIAQDMRINRYAPYSLHGRIFTMGVTFTFLFFVLIGIVYSYFENIIRQYLFKGNKWVPFILILLLTLHIVYAFEYNMRSAIRYLYYTFAVLFLIRFFEIIYRMLIKKVKING